MGKDILIVGGINYFTKFTTDEILRSLYNAVNVNKLSKIEKYLLFNRTDS